MTPYLLEVFNMTLPPEGPGVVPIVIDFDGTFTETEIDLTQMVNDGVVSYISGVQMDTLESTVGSVRIECNSTGQRIVADFGGISLMPLFLPNPPKVIVRAVDGYLGLLRLHFVNFPIWPLNAGGSGGGGGGAIGPIAGPAMTTDSLVLDATSQEIVAAGAAASYFLLQNPASASGSVFLNLGGGDASALGQEVLPGGSLELPNGVSNAITIYGNNADVVIFTRGA